MHCQTTVLCGLQSLQIVPNPIIELETNSYSFCLLSVAQPGTCSVIPLDVRDVEGVQGQRLLSLIFTPECCRDNMSKSVSCGENALFFETRMFDRAGWFEGSYLEEKVM